MKNLIQRVCENPIMQSVIETRKVFNTPEEVIKSWESNISIKEANTELGQKGLRLPQIGALYALLSHWTTSEDPSTIVMPTGTGKTETMLCAIVAQRCEKVLIVVPSNLLRKQIAEKCISLGILRDIGILNKKIINPVVTLLKKTPKSIDDLNLIIEKSNIVVTTVNLINIFPESFLNKMSSCFSHLFIDEAHHVEATTWKTFKSKFSSKTVVQFTATPFRNDGKKIDGKIIYNFPLAKAQENGYFKPINFIPIFEFDDQRSDFAIAEKAIEQLKKDESKGYNHVILVRSDKKSQAERIYNEIYNVLYKEYNPVLVYSGIKKKDKDKAIENIKNGTSKILVCVDMFGEGIDIPQLKIAAIHERYKSLPITIQFIGRFARSQEGLGEASIIANIAKDDIDSAIKELYSEDADWNKILRVISSDAIGKEISLQELARGFSGNAIKEVKIEQLMPKVSLVAFKTDTSNWNINGWKNIFDETKCLFKVNEEEKVAVIIEKVESKLGWSKLKEINNISWELHLVYWNRNTQMLFINSTNKAIHRKLAENIVSKPEIISGENAFRCLHGINLLESTCRLHIKRVTNAR